MPETLQQLLALPVPLPLIFGIVTTIGIIGIIVILLRPRPPATDAAAEQRMADLNARVQAMGELLAKAQGQLQQTVHERLDAVTARLGESMQTSTKHTAEHLQQLHARLAVIDNAQKNITDLATQVTSLQNVLSNKQSRGAFGQAQLEAIVADILPKGAFEFQYTLSNRMRPDCVIFMPDSGPLVIDAKFPLEAMTAFRDAQTEDDRKAAIQRVRQDIAKHITDIAGKYLLPGETQDIALMFIPSESVYAELHERFDDMVQRAQRARVMIVSPTLMVMAIQVIKQVRKDAQMREAADQIRNEVGHMMKDVRLLGERVRKLQTHLGQTTTDVESILTSAGRIEKRAARIEDLEFDGDSGGAEVIPAPIRSLGAAE
ncbi:DNA recombination protein RmuC [Pseudolabrys taiwanensis]|uniref:DNA recombination protein RmuC homolog n=1 Tax=Pseudolabrys taiwanensis TaxID=331696 RepID=A0A346A0W6_9HYPH|nr:DNA recombination protein RmuC [Pseudolabrys taiwanensis]AXK82813.1 DNA recombination protein RmuC [Pseudolabrys taiwanensis]